MLAGRVQVGTSISLLNHGVRKYPNDSIRDSWYMRPYPAE